MGWHFCGRRALKKWDAIFAAQGRLRNGTPFFLETRQHIYGYDSLMNVLKIETEAEADDIPGYLTSQDDITG